ncbi:MAG TPA: hypothetical protein VGK10_19580, partial [Prolixibacteraceae bacterium]
IKTQAKIILFYSQPDKKNPQIDFCQKSKTKGPVEAMLGRIRSQRGWYKPSKVRLHLCYRLILICHQSPAALL